VTTRIALYIVGGAAVILAVYYAFGRHAGVAANNAGLTSSSPPPQPGTFFSSASRGLGAFAPAGKFQFFR
jgi:hypothetical protein